jgi:hypothetical protein
MRADSVNLERAFSANLERALHKHLAATGNHPELHAYLHRLHCLMRDTALILATPAPSNKS